MVQMMVDRPTKDGYGEGAAGMLLKFKAGFTLVELIITILVVAILAAVAFPRLSLQGYRETGFFNQSLAAIRFGQKQAVSSGCHVQVQIDTSGCRLFWTGSPGGCPGAGTPITNPIGASANFCAQSTPSGTPSATFTFDNIGRPGGTQIINLGSRTITVEAETGYAHET